MKYHLGIILLPVILFLATPKLEAQGQSTRRNVNLFLYVSAQDKNSSFTRLLPFYSHNRDADRLYDELFFWPFFSGYQVSKNPLPSMLPHRSNFQWNTFPLLTLGGSLVFPGEQRETSSMVSFLLMTYFQEDYIKNKYAARSWYSLPVLSFYHNETLKDKNTEINNITIGNPIFWFKDITVSYNDMVFPAHKWSIHPASILIGDKGFTLADKSRWGHDHHFELFAFDNFSLFSVNTTFAAYPGADYEYFSQYEADIKKGLPRLFSPKLAYPTTRLGILSPLMIFETNPSGIFSWQCIPFFYFRSEPDNYRLNFLLLGLEIGSKGLSFRPLPKLFPFLYNDERSGRWDILWPLFQYTRNPVMPGTRSMSLRFVFEYRRYMNSQGQSSLHFNLVEGLLFSYRQRATGSQFEILPIGLLFGYYRDQQHYQWRFLGFGYQETAQKDSLQLLFIKIPIHYKKPSE